MCRHYEEGEEDQREARRKDDKKKRDKYSTSRPKVCRTCLLSPTHAGYNVHCITIDTYGIVSMVLQCR